MSIRDTVIRHATELIKRPSTVGNEQGVSDYFYEVLKDLGFECHSIEVTQGRFNVFAILNGDSRYRSFMLNGHFDTGAPYGVWTGDPYIARIEGDTIYGAGIEDMKGGLASILGAAELLSNDKRSPRGDLIISGVIQHDVTGLGIKHLLGVVPHRIDAAICAEPTNLNAQIAHSGCLGFRVSITGVPRHVSRMTEGASAIYVGSDVLNTLRQMTFPESWRSTSMGPELVVGKARGGEHPPELAEHCVLEGDVRYPEIADPIEIYRTLELALEDVRAAHPMAQIEIELAYHEWPFSIPSDSTIIRSLAASHEQVTGRPIVRSDERPASLYITDAADMARSGIETVVYGPGNFTTSADESMSITDMEQAALIFAAAASDVSSQSRP